MTASMEDRPDGDCCKAEISYVWQPSPVAAQTIIHDRFVESLTWWNLEICMLRKWGVLTGLDIILDTIGSFDKSDLKMNVAKRY